ncbi:hypothetical protein PENDEC_c004G01613 [Penicillium decumbens]|uniref:Uncharacterized protein n=1 Tax=Penicillium decumbens TaxID=69771 RepID=A0A1V6PHV3_PENDC|nr:hypothetical protein PENDEC_c004G01613 [Penicillium decumbens]
MFFSNVFITSILAATAAALPHSARDSGSGSVQFVNNMGSDVYLWTTAADPGSMKTLNSGGGTHSEGWQDNSNGGGVSIKLSTTQSDTDSVLQFEYTVNSDTLFWDLSSINMNPSSDFIKSGFSVTPSDSSCKSATCAAGDANCADSYQHPDDVNTLSCSTSANYVVTLG